jgi:pimeloyl-ACP methyl ester carboxylesterase
MQNLLLLHGALGTGQQFQPLREQLATRFNTHHLTFGGHGERSSESTPFSIPEFARQTLQWLDDHKQEDINIFGYSMGGYVALYLARHHPSRVRKIFTLATKFDWSPESAAREVKMLDAEKISAKLPDFARSLALRHGESTWKKVLERTAAMMLEMGADKPLKDEDFSAIGHDVLLAVGDRDKMVSIEETVESYRKLAKGSLLVLPSTPHPLESVDAAALAAAMGKFFKG